MTTSELPLTEWVVLALLDEAPRHGFAVARELTPEAPLGRVWTVSRPLTYRAVDQLLAKGMAEAAHSEPSDEGGPNRTIMRPTAAGRRAVRKWRVAPVEHLREMRSAFLVKLPTGGRLSTPSSKPSGLGSNASRTRAARRNPSRAGVTSRPKRPAGSSKRFAEVAVSRQGLTSCPSK
jgi:DNA-binding PadR family transcriptional regulator